MKIKNIIKNCLEIRGYNFTNEQIDSLISIYEDCQEWDENGNMITGNSYDEIEDFIRHSRMIDLILD